MTILAWFLLIFFILALVLCLFFLFYVLIPSIKNEDVANKNPVFSEVELNYVIPKEEIKRTSDKRAVVLCNPSKQFSVPLNKFNKMHSCQIAASVFTSGSDCKFACIGLGDCVEACPQEAIYIDRNTAVVSNLCTGCGECVPACPKGIIKLLPKENKSFILCNNADQTLTTCDKLRKEEKIERKDKKGFKIWSSCYKILEH